MKNQLLWIEKSFKNYILQKIAFKNRNLLKNKRIKFYGKRLNRRAKEG